MRDLDEEKKTLHDDSAAEKTLSITFAIPVKAGIRSHTGTPMVYVDPDLVETNIVLFEVVRSGRSTGELVQALKDAGVLLNAMGEHRFRAVTHLDVSSADIEQATQRIGKVLGV